MNQGIVALKTNVAVLDGKQNRQARVNGNLALVVADVRKAVPASEKKYDGAEPLRRIITRQLKNNKSLSLGDRRVLEECLKTGITTQEVYAHAIPAYQLLRKLLSEEILKGAKTSRQKPLTEPIMVSSHGGWGC